MLLSRPFLNSTSRPRSGYRDRDLAKWTQVHLEFRDLDLISRLQHCTQIVNMNHAVTNSNSKSGVLYCALYRLTESASHSSSSNVVFRRTTMWAWKFWLCAWAMLLSDTASSRSVVGSTHARCRHRKRTFSDFQSRPANNEVAVSWRAECDQREIFAIGVNRSAMYFCNRKFSSC